MKSRDERQPGSADREVLAGLVERVTFHNPDSGFCVLRVKARGHRDLVTVVGHAAMVAAGEWITASGEWVNDRTHGQQFKARFLRSSAPSSIEGIEKYLGSGMIRGIGPIYARKLVRAFGEEVFDVIEAEPERLREVNGIGRVRAGRITDAWAEQKVVREIMVFLHSHGVGTARAVRIFRTYGADAIEVMSENPYRLARDIRGIGFKSADAIAMKLGITKTAMIRVRAGIGYALTEAMDEGHCGLPAEELGPLATRLLDVPDDVIRTALDLELAEGTVVADTVAETPCVFLGVLHRAERAIAERLLGIAAGKLPWPAIDAERALPWVERKTGLSLAPGQAEAVRLALASKAVVITGGPGVGKTTIVDTILRILAAKGVERVLCAPTGRAARRLSEATGLEARTIHRLLEVDPGSGGFRRNADNPLDCGLLVVDEASMVDVMLMRALLAAVPDQAALLIVGDVYNGDIGQVADVDPEAGELTARFDGREHVYGFGELDTLVPAYAATVHKSQGSEYPAVVIPVLTQHYAMLRRNLLYTGVTRGKRLVVLAGQTKAVAIAVRNVSGRRRWSKLDEWLSGPEGESATDRDASAATEIDPDA